MFDQFNDVPQHCRPSMFAAARTAFPWEAQSDDVPDQPAASPTTEPAPSAWYSRQETPPKSAPTRPTVMPAPRQAVTVAPLVKTASPQTAQAASSPQEARSSPGHQQPIDPSRRRRKMLRPRCVSEPAALSASSSAWAVETELADDSFLLALQAVEQQAGGGGGGEGGPRHREAGLRAAAAAEVGRGDVRADAQPLVSSLPDHPKRRRRLSEIDEVEGIHEPVELRGDDPWAQPSAAGRMARAVVAEEEWGSAVEAEGWDVAEGGCEGVSEGRSTGVPADPHLWQPPPHQVPPTLQQPPEKALSWALPSTVTPGPVVARLPSPPPPAPSWPQPRPEPQPQLQQPQFQPPQPPQLPQPHQPPQPPPFWSNPFSSLAADATAGPRAFPHGAYSHMPDLAPQHSTPQRASGPPSAASRRTSARRATTPSSYPTTTSTSTTTYTTLTRRRWRG